MAQHDPETLTLLKEAMEQEKGNLLFQSTYPGTALFSPSKYSYWGTYYLVYNQVLLPFVASSSKSLNLDSLAAFDVAKLPDTKVLGQDILQRIQELQLKHWGHKDIGVLPEDTIQYLLLGANSILDIALTIEKGAITLKQQGLRLWNVALGGHACGCMLCVLEDIFGLPESEESKRFDKSLVPEKDTEETLPEGAEDYPPMSQNPSSSSSSVDSKQQETKHPILSNLLAPAEGAAKIPKTSSEPKGKQRELPLDSATPFLMSLEKEITMVGVSLNDICLGRSTVARNPCGRQSVYQCRVCSYVTEQKAQAATHVHKYHAHNCIQCRL